MKGIYKFTNVVTNKVYVGSSSNLIRRYQTHIHELTKGRSGCAFLQNSVTKHGINNFSFTILEFVEDVSKLLEREEFWIRGLKSHEKEFGYNIKIVPNGNQGLKLSKEHKEKISRGLIGRKVSQETKDQISESLKGHSFKEETLEKMRNAKLGKASKKRVPVIKYDLNWNYIEEYDGLKEAASKNKCGVLGILQAANHQRENFKGFNWKYKENIVYL